MLIKVKEDMDTTKVNTVIHIIVKGNIQKLGPPLFQGNSSGFQGNQRPNYNNPQQTPLELGPPTTSLETMMQIFMTN